MENDKEAKTSRLFHQYLLESMEQINPVLQRMIDIDEVPDFRLRPGGTRWLWAGNGLNGGELPWVLASLWN